MKNNLNCLLCKSSIYGNYKCNCGSLRLCLYSVEKNKYIFSAEFDEYLFEYFLNGNIIYVFKYISDNLIISELAKHFKIKLPHDEDQKIKEDLFVMNYNKDYTQLTINELIKDINNQIILR